MILLNLPLEGERHLDVRPRTAVHPVDVEEGAVLGQVDAVIRHLALDARDFLLQKRDQAVAEDGAVIRKCHVHIGTLIQQRAHQGRRHVG
jgi:hypothetical protein